MEGHRFKCPKLQQEKARREAAYFQPACNYGSGDEVDLQVASARTSFAEQWTLPHPQPSAAEAAAPEAATPAGVSPAAVSCDAAPVGVEAAASAGFQRNAFTAPSSAGSIAAARKERQPPSSAQRAAYAAEMGEARLRTLIGQIQAAHSQVPVPQQFKINQI